jgi:hypothetical protein
LAARRGLRGTDRYGAGTPFTLYPWPREEDCEALTGTGCALFTLADRAASSFEWKDEYVIVKQLNEFEILGLLHLAVEARCDGAGAMR